MSAEGEADRITSLPGLSDEDFEGMESFAGLVPIDFDGQEEYGSIFYWLFRAHGSDWQVRQARTTLLYPTYTAGTNAARAGRRRPCLPNLNTSRNTALRS